MAVALAEQGPPHLAAFPRRGNRSAPPSSAFAGTCRERSRPRCREISNRKASGVRKGTSPQSFTAIASFVDAAVIDSAAKSDKNAAWVRHRAPARGGQATTPGPSRTDRLTSGAIAGSKAPERSGKAAKGSVSIARHDAAISPQLALGPRSNTSRRTKFHPHIGLETFCYERCQPLSVQMA
jgi:hypothetical protein